MAQVMYLHEASGERSRVGDVDTAVEATDMLERALEVLEPWVKVYTAGEHRVSYTNPRTGVEAVTTDDVARANALDELPDPPAPWEKKVEHRASIFDAGSGGATGWLSPTEWVAYYWRVPVGPTANTIAEVRQMDAVAAAPDPGPGWSAVWNKETELVVYTCTALRGTTVASLAEVVEANALHAAPVVEGWTKAWVSGLEQSRAVRCGSCVYVCRSSALLTPPPPPPPSLASPPLAAQ
jgi:hypothetical protein